MNIAVSRIVDVKVLTSPTFPQRKGFGLLNIVGKSARLPVGDRARFYSNMDGVSADFSGTDEEYKAAQIFFSQSPRPTQLMISRRFDIGAPGELLGGLGSPTTIATYTVLNAAKLTIPINGTPIALTAIDLSAVTTLTGVAAAIQAKLTTALPGSTITWNGQRFIVQSPTVGIASTVGFVTAVAGQDLGPIIKLDAAGLGLLSTGVAIETITASLNALQDFNNAWYGVTFTKEITTADIKEVAAWTEARIKLFGYTSANSDIVDAGSTVDLGSFFKLNLYSRTIGIWDLDDPYAVISAFARGFTVNFNEQNSTITLKFKQLPGTTPSNITESQRQTLVKKNVNYYVFFGDSAMLAEGIMASGQFFDERHGLDWLQNAVETNVFGYLFTRTTKVPQTDKGVQSIVQQIEKAMNEGVNNGLLAPGQWNGMDLGEVRSGDFLTKGFYVFAQPVALQNQSDREARKAPPIQVIAKGAGAIHSVDVTITFER